MTDNETFLFEVEEPSPPTGLLPTLAIRPEQIREIRAAFESAGIHDQTERRSLIESVVIREVKSLRELHAIEARRILKRIEDTGSPTPSAAGSAWDNREEDTWIDKL